MRNTLLRTSARLALAMALCIPNTALANIPVPIQRLWGSSRYDTMAAIVDEAFDDREPYAVVASGENFPDALAASALAGAVDGPVVLTDPTSLSPQAEEQLRRLGVRRVYLMGGTSSVSASVEEALQGMGIGVTRIAGTNRVETSLLSMNETFAAGSDSHTVIVASGSSFADSLSIGPWAYDSESPIVLTQSDGTLSQEAVQAITSNRRIRNVVMVGGTAVVSDVVRSQLGAESYRFERLAGATRYETSAAIARWAVRNGLEWDEPCVASGKNFPDALAGAALAGDEESPLLLVSGPADPTVDLIRQNATIIEKLYVLGGQASVPGSVLHGF